MSKKHRRAVYWWVRIKTIQGEMWSSFFLRNRAIFIKGGGGGGEGRVSERAHRKRRQKLKRLYFILKKPKVHEIRCGVVCVHERVMTKGGGRAL
jgi:hypothetical protein